MKTSFGGWFHTSHFVQLVNDAFTNAINQTSNAGQIAILNEILNNGIEPLIKLASSSKRKPSPSIMRSFFVIVVGPEKANAVENITKDLAIQIIQAWDDATAGDGVRDKMYLNIAPGQFITTVPSTNALKYQNRIRLINVL